MLQNQIDDREPKVDTLHGIAKYFALVINHFNVRVGSFNLVLDDISISVAKQAHYDSAEFGCQLFRYFITQYEPDLYRFSVVQKPIVAILAEMIFDTNEMAKHELFESRVNECMQCAYTNHFEGTGTATDDFPPLA